MNPKVKKYFDNLMDRQVAKIIKQLGDYYTSKEFIECLKERRVANK